MTMAEIKDKMIYFRAKKEKKRKLMLYAFDNDTTILEKYSSITRIRL